MPAPPRIHRMIEEPREMTREDLARLSERCYVPQPTVATLRNAHHRIARLASVGLRQFEIAARTGYTETRVSQLLKAPAMQDLVARYSRVVNETHEKHIDEYHDVAIRNMVLAESLISDRLAKAEEEGIDLPLKDLIALTGDRADRFGYPRKTESKNVNVDFAARLDKMLEDTKKSEEVKRLLSA